MLPLRLLTLTTLVILLALALPSGSERVTAQRLDWPLVIELLDQPSHLIPGGPNWLCAVVRNQSDTPVRNVSILVQPVPINITEWAPDYLQVMNSSDACRPTPTPTRPAASASDTGSMMVNIARQSTVIIGWRVHVPACATLDELRTYEVMINTPDDDTDTQTKTVVAEISPGGVDSLWTQYRDAIRSHEAGQSHSDSVAPPVPDMSVSAEIDIITPSVNDNLRAGEIETWHIQIRNTGTVSLKPAIFASNISCLFTDEDFTIRRNSVFALYERTPGKYSTLPAVLNDNIVRDWGSQWLRHGVSLSAWNMQPGSVVHLIFKARIRSDLGTGTLPPVTFEVLYGANSGSGDADSATPAVRVLHHSRLNYSAPIEPLSPELLERFDWKNIIMAEILGFCIILVLFPGLRDYVGKFGTIIIGAFMLVAAIGTIGSSEGYIEMFMPIWGWALIAVAGVPFAVICGWISRRCHALETIRQFYQRMNDG